MKPSASIKLNLKRFSGITLDNTLAVDGFDYLRRAKLAIGIDRSCSLFINTIESALGMSSIIVDLRNAQVVRVKCSC